MHTTPASTAEQYLLNAEECVLWAQSTANEQTRKTYLHLSRVWTQAAQMTRGIGANLTNDEKRTHLIDIKCEHLMDQVLPSGNPSS